MSSGVNTIGFKEFQRKLSSMPSKLERAGGAYALDAAKEWERNAKRSAPVNFGALRNTIGSAKISKTEAEVFANSNYARFVEWGTRSKKKVPAELQAYESTLTYQKTGDYYDFLNSILDWVKKKGIGRTYNVKTRRKNRQTVDEFLAIAQAIANSIMRNGINPNPFFFIHKEQARQRLYNNLKQLVEKTQ